MVQFCNPETQKAEGENPKLKVSLDLKQDPILKKKIFLKEPVKVNYSQLGSHGKFKDN